MPKMKTRRSAAKRYRLTGTGKIRRAKACASHMLARKRRNRKRRLRDNDTIDKADERMARKLVPYA
jgi:large subunit ribosomal protein L35